MEYDIIFVTGELFFDHPLCGIAILKRLLEKHGYRVGVIEMPQKDEDVKKLGKPRLFFGVSSGSIDSMVRNYTPLKKLRKDDKNLDYNESVPDRAVIVYSNWIKKYFKDSIIVLGGTEASLRRFVHYDYWDNKLRKPVLFDSRANIIAYGSAEKQILEIAERIKCQKFSTSLKLVAKSQSQSDDGKFLSMLKNHPDAVNDSNIPPICDGWFLTSKKPLNGISGTCIVSTEKPAGFVELPSYEEVLNSKEKFCDMQNMLSNNRNLAQKIDNRYVLQYKSPKYLPNDLDEYYSLPFTRKVHSKHLSGFEFSIVTHRGCIGGCNFCSLNLMQGDKIISRPEESILKEIERITRMPHFKGNIDDFGGPSANMYGMDCYKCEKDCIECGKLDRSHNRLVNLLRKARAIKGVKHVYVRSGIRYDLVNPKYLEELAKYHISGKLKIAPEHVNKDVLRLMNKDKGNLNKFISDFKKLGCGKLSFYFMVAHPGSRIEEARELAAAIKKLKNAESVQVFTPTPMTVSTCMYYTGLDPKTKKKVYIPYSYSEKKEQKRAVFGRLGIKDEDW
ncbi:YgiQ family radical SAM protein [Candidatus Woesearchaeota archaeon]|nr:YgiQ family radical SAM protein [Candidatus Woesearchaeota archaeon]